LNGLGVCERSLEELVQVCAIVRDDDELRDPLRLIVVVFSLERALAAAGRARGEVGALASGI